MAVYGVTGSRSITAHHKRSIQRVAHGAIREVDPVTLVHGACIGADETAAVIASVMRARIVAVLPPDRSRVSAKALRHSDEVIEIPDGPDGFKRRNQAIVDRAEMLLAFPLYPEDHPKSRRSGTWQTIRMARRKGIPVLEYVLSEVR